jgi:uncharacterized protein YggE
MSNDNADTPVDSGGANAFARGGLARPLQVGQMLVALLVIIALVATWALAHQRSTPRSTISVSGSATVQGKPDTINFQIGVHTQSDTASVALSSNNLKAQALINALESHGVKKSDIQTSNLNLNQTYANNGTPNGYAVDNSLNVTMHNISGAGTTIDGAIRSVGNGATLSGVTLSISNQKALLATARARAVLEARRAADQLASAAKTHVVGLVSLVDQENQPSPLPFNSFKTATNPASVPVEAGSQAITVQVSVVYAIAN